MRFEAVLAQWENRAMSQAEAARALGVTERTFRRWCQRYEEDGLDGLLDRRIGKPSPKRVVPPGGTPPERPELMAVGADVAVCRPLVAVRPPVNDTPVKQIHYDPISP